MEPHQLLRRMKEAATVCTHKSEENIHWSWQIFENSEESKLLALLRIYASIGYGKTRKDVMAIGDNKSQGWWYEFASR